MPASQAIWMISFACIVLMLIRPRNISEGWWIGGGAVSLVALRLVPLRLAIHAVGKGTDVSAWKFLKAGLIVMPPALVLATLAATFLSR